MYGLQVKIIHFEFSNMNAQFKLYNFVQPYCIQIRALHTMQYNLIRIRFSFIILSIDTVVGHCIANALTIHHTYTPRIDVHIVQAPRR